MNDGASYFTVAKDDGSALLDGVTEATISFDAQIADTSAASWAFDITSEESHSWPSEHYLGGLLNAGVTAERYNNTDGRPSSASYSADDFDTTAWHHYDVIYYADGMHRYLC
ncbi:MAG: hypothetical protein LUE25_02975 [Clostridiales bacterium]|nr:hypothetical protein [Clostridiales bacterium]